MTKITVNISWVVLVLLIVNVAKQLFTSIVWLGEVGCSSWVLMQDWRPLFLSFYLEFIITAFNLHRWLYSVDTEATHVLYRLMNLLLACRNWIVIVMSCKWNKNWTVCVLSTLIGRCNEQLAIFVRCALPIFSVIIIMSACCVSIVPCCAAW